ncbi:TIGR03557 family F420-dependent LLM class oxidoreductase [Frankia sp. CNm7]|uniref:TIGR03557 family F420-dependent LLM class oxidoreductase n=1 Tax=Frankia nepalensis TaxID=1836974 RepID=A0A937UQ43_9ACTN|nr:TIGR03557 family F420-dependent LLM class oxidoreductase [Frankia nepalensis]MBL7500540.1 TIGR03557 family F420-dependent LLM class oxidoreductase [Frankia nepalensis]MBL7509766.1 TIGR03557 family F420-dependent LLM class oxidoreductase [Frankia nepalensis]MBL7523270.1 TIGR03557 family F420-dependent LLM class oxidoreductase [Frankia nepalensis]MBL7627885.1 TIGR03557 family F420-dependent LLM class oxidoreductase [Frankia nepalensis]
MQIGYKLMTEAFGPKEIIRQAVAAEAAGFDFVELSDHFHPWLDDQGHSAFTWSMLGAIAQSTDRIELATGVTCPTIRYHPAVIAQAAATVALLSDGRFTLGLGSGERLNEHVVGREYPPVTQRHAMLREAIEIIRLLWSGGYQSYDGRYLRLEDARIFDLPRTPPQIAVAASGEPSARLAAECGDALFATEPKPAIVEHYAAAGGTGPCYAEVPLAYAPDEATAARAVVNTTRWALTGWKVMSELPNPVNFAAATTTVTERDVAEQFACGPDPARHLAVADRFVDAGFDRLALLNAGPDPDEFLDFFRAELAEPLRSRAAAAPVGAGR